MSRHTDAHRNQRTGNGNSSKNNPSSTASSQRGSALVPTEKRQDLLLITCTGICQDLLHLTTACTEYCLQAVTASSHQPHRAPPVTAACSLCWVLPAAHTAHRLHSSWAKPFFVSFVHSISQDTCIILWHRRINAVNDCIVHAALLQSGMGRVHQPFWRQRQPQHSGDQPCFQRKPLEPQILHYVARNLKLNYYANHVLIKNRVLLIFSV